MVDRLCKSTIAVALTPKGEQTFNNKKENASCFRSSACTDRLDVKRELGHGREKLPLALHTAAPINDPVYRLYLASLNLIKFQQVDTLFLFFFLFFTFCFL